MNGALRILLAFQLLSCPVWCQQAACCCAAQAPRATLHRCSAEVDAWSTPAHRSACRVRGGCESGGRQLQSCAGNGATCHGQSAFGGRIPSGDHEAPVPPVGHNYCQCICAGATDTVERMWDDPPGPAVDADDAALQCLRPVGAAVRCGPGLGAGGLHPPRPQGSGEPVGRAICLRHCLLLL